MKAKDLIWIYFLLFPFLPVYADGVFRVVASGVGNLYYRVLTFTGYKEAFNYQALNGYLPQLLPFEGFVRFLLALFTVGFLYAVYERYGRRKDIYYDHAPEYVLKAGLIRKRDGVGIVFGYLLMLLPTIFILEGGRLKAFPTALQTLILPYAFTISSLAELWGKVAAILVPTPDLSNMVRPIPSILHDVEYNRWIVNLFFCAPLTILLGGLTLILGNRLGAWSTKLTVLKLREALPVLKKIHPYKDWDLFAELVRPQDLSRIPFIKTIDKPPLPNIETSPVEVADEGLEKPPSFTASASLKKASKAVGDVDESKPSSRPRKWRPRIGELLQLWLELDRDGNIVLPKFGRWKIRFAETSNSPPKLREGWKEKWELEIVYRQKSTKTVYVIPKRKLEEEPITRPRQPGEDIEDYLERTDRRLEPWEEDVQKRKRPRMEI